MRAFSRGIITLMVLLLTVSLWRCDKKITGDFTPNQPPETTIFVGATGDSVPVYRITEEVRAALLAGGMDSSLVDSLSVLMGQEFLGPTEFLTAVEGVIGAQQTARFRLLLLRVAGNTLNFTRSVQTIHWDGRDPDGFVVGFRYTFTEHPQPEDWTFTEERSLTFPLQITGTDTIYLFQVKAVDNQGAEDPTPARQFFPILNSPPSIEWASNSNIPDTTFTVAAFSWSATDLDGENTIAAFEYALDDTTNWQQIDGEKRSLVLREADGLTEGEHALFLRAVDIAGAHSQILRMPEDPNRFWYVKRPQGRYLLIDDFLNEVNSNFPDRYYRSMLDSLLTPIGEGFSYWNIEEQFPSSITQFVETLKLFDRVIWYTDLIDETDPHFVAAQVAIPEFRQNGGKIIYTVQFNTGFGGQGDPLGFSPVDSLGRKFNFIATNARYYPDSAFATAFPTLSPLPELTVSTFILGIIALVPKATSVPMYRYDDPATGDDPIFIMVGKNDNTGEFDFVFSATPMHYLRGQNNANEADLNEVFRILLMELFGP